MNLASLTSYFYDEPKILDQEIFVNEKMKISDLDMVIEIFESISFNSWK